MRDGLIGVWQESAGIDNTYTHSMGKKVKQQSIAGQLGLKSEELAALIANGGGSVGEVVIAVSKAKAVHTADGNPWAEY